MIFQVELIGKVSSEQGESGRSLSQGIIGILVLADILDLN
jgi:hypothetical protein